MTRLRIARLRSIEQGRTALRRGNPAWPPRTDGFLILVSPIVRIGTPLREAVIGANSANVHFVRRADISVQNLAALCMNGRLSRCIAADVVDR